MKILLCALWILFSLTNAYAVKPSNSEKAVSSSSRTADDKKADENRHPKEMLDFSKIKSGDTVVDFFTGRGYFTRLFSSFVGPKAHVIDYVPK